MSFAKCFRLPAELAQIDLSRFSPLEDRLMHNATIIGVVYLVIVALGVLVDVSLLMQWRTAPIRWREKFSRLYWRPWNNVEASHLVLLLVLMYGVLMLANPLIKYLMEQSGVSLTSALIILQGITFHWTGLLFVILSLARRRLSWKSAFGLDAAKLLPHAAKGLVLFLGTMPLLVFYTVLYHLGLQLLGHDTRLQDVVYAISDETSLGMRVYFVFFAVAIAPLFEEMLFRGIVLPVLAQRWGVGMAVAVVSLIFALVHGHVPSLVPLFLLSVALCMAYIYTESIMVSVVMHGLFNAVTVTLLMTAS